MSRPLRIAATSALVAVVALGGCSSSDDDSAGGDGAASADTVPVVAEDIAFDQEAYEAEAGEVTFELTNEGVLEHNLLIEGVDGFRVEVPAAGDTASGTTTLEAGEYTIYCDVDGHREAGMESTLTVS